MCQYLRPWTSVGLRRRLYPHGCTFQLPPQESHARKLRIHVYVLIFVKHRWEVESWFAWHAYPIKLMRKLALAEMVL